MDSKISLPAPPRWGRKSARCRPRAELIHAVIPAMAGILSTAREPAANQAAPVAIHGLVRGYVDCASVDAVWNRPVALSLEACRARRLT